MTKSPSRLKRQHVAESASEIALSASERGTASESGEGSNESEKLTSVQALHPEMPGGSSGVYVVEREDQNAKQAKSTRKREQPKPDVTKSSQATERTTQGKKMNPLLEQVTLVVYGWHNVEPGTLSWVFPSVGAAVAAARAMKNAVRWAIVAGRRREASDDDLDDARAHGAVLIEEG
jgi:hypothetical protein